VLVFIWAIRWTLNTTTGGQNQRLYFEPRSSECSRPNSGNMYLTLLKQQTSSRILDIPGTKKSLTLHVWHVPILEMTTHAAVISCDLHLCRKEHVFFCLLYCAPLLWNVNAHYSSNKCARIVHCDRDSFWLCYIHGHITLHGGKHKVSGLDKCNNFRSTVVTDLDDTLQSSPLWSFKPVTAPLLLLEAPLEPRVVKRYSNARDPATIAAISSNFLPFN